MTTATLKPRRQARYTAKPIIKKIDKPILPPSPKLSMVIHTAAGDRFRARPLNERRQIIDEFAAAVGRAFEGTTLDDYLAERRREAEHDA